MEIDSIVVAMCLNSYHGNNNDSIHTQNNDQKAATVCTREATYSSMINMYFTAGLVYLLLM